MRRVISSEKSQGTKPSFEKGLTGRRGHSPGFTVLEVALALAILAVALTALSTLQARNLALTSEESLLTEGVLAAKDLMARIRVRSLPLETSEDDMGEEYAGWRWAMVVQQAEGLPLVRVELKLLKEGQPPERALSFWFLAFKKETR